MPFIKHCRYYTVTGNVSGATYITYGKVEELLLPPPPPLLLLLLLTAIQLSLGGSSPYTSTDRTDKNKYT